MKTKTKTNKNIIALLVAGACLISNAIGAESEVSPEHSFAQYLNVSPHTATEKRELIVSTYIDKLMGERAVDRQYGGPGILAELRRIDAFFRSGNIVNGDEKLPLIDRAYTYDSLRPMISHRVYSVRADVCMAGQLVIKDWAPEHIEEFNLPGLVADLETKYLERIYSILRKENLSPRILNADDSDEDDQQ
jgi:hypothetical protein